MKHPANANKPDSNPNMQPIFFDLDHTLWDFETNSQNTISDLLEGFKDKIPIPLSRQDFFSVYTRMNEACWDLYRKKQITQEELRIKRFKETFEVFGISYSPWQQDFAKEYLAECPRKGTLMPGALETLEVLSQYYRIFLITNGFEAVQKTKLQHADIGQYISGMITSETAGCTKPDKKIFDCAIQKSGTQSPINWYIGDDYDTDVRGGTAAGMKAVFYNPARKANPDGYTEIQSLMELIPLLEVSEALNL